MASGYIRLETLDGNVLMRHGDTLSNVLMDWDNLERKGQGLYFQLPVTITEGFSLFVMATLVRVTKGKQRTSLGKLVLQYEDGVFLQCKKFR